MWDLSRYTVVFHGHIVARGPVGEHSRQRAQLTHKPVGNGVMCVTEE